MSYDIKIYDIDSYGAYISNLASAAKGKIDALVTAAQQLQSESDFQGETADSIKAYWGEAIVSAARGFEDAFVELYTRYGVYAQPYVDGEIDTCKTAQLNSDAITDAASEMQDMGADFQRYGSQAEGILSQAIPLVGGSIPDLSGALGSVQDASDKASDLDMQVSNQESSNSSEAQSLSGLIDSLESVVSTLGSYGGGSAYTAGDIRIDDPDLYDALTGSEGYISDHSEDASAAYADINENLTEIREEQGKEFADRRGIAGIFEIVGGVVLAAAGVGLIAASAGAATPFVLGIGMGIAGGLFGTSDAIEGFNDIGLGHDHDGSTEAFNPMRDVVFDRMFGGDDDPLTESASDTAYSIVDTGIGFAVDYMTPIAKAGKPLLKTTTSSAFVFEQVDDTGKVVGTGSKYVCEQEVEHIKPKVWRKLADEWSYEMIPLSDYAISTPGGGTFAWVESASKRTVKTTSETLENGMRKGGKSC